MSAAAYSPSAVVSNPSNESSHGPPRGQRPRGSYRKHSAESGRAVEVRSHADEVADRHDDQKPAEPADDDELSIRPWSQGFEDVTRTSSQAFQDGRHNAIFASGTGTLDDQRSRRWIAHSTGKRD